MTYIGPGSPPWHAGYAAGSQVPGAAAACAAGRCRLTQALQIIGQAEELNRKLLQRHDRRKMSQALWCDAGGHAFSERDPGRQRITVAVLNEETDREEEESRDYCGDCAKKAGLLSPRKTRPAAAIVRGEKYDD